MGAKHNLIFIVKCAQSLRRAPPVHPAPSAATFSLNWLQTLLISAGWSLRIFQTSRCWEWALCGVMTYCPDLLQPRYSDRGSFTNSLQIWTWTLGLQQEPQRPRLVFLRVSRDDSSSETLRSWSCTLTKTNAHTAKRGGLTDHSCDAEQIWGCLVHDV